MKTFFLMLVCSFLVVFLSACAPEKTSEKQRPNFIIIIADDAAWDDNAAYGNAYIRTPNIKKLAEEGMTFTNAFLTTSSCSPSRCSILTGLYPHNTGAKALHQPLPADKLLFPGVLQQRGYYTVAAGKWHIGPPRAEFDSIFQGSGATHWVRAIKNRPADKPFFMWLASRDPHRDYTQGTISNSHNGDEVIVPPYLPDNDSTRKDLAMYYDEIARLDSDIGAVMGELKRQGIAENTVVIFMSDNGRPFPRDKTRLYDSGIKTPFIVRWPAEIKPGTHCPGLISSLDIAPTFCELAGIAIPEVFQGASFASLFADPEREIHEYVFAEHNWHDYQATERAVRSKHYLFIQNDFPGLTATPPADAVRSPTYQEMIRLNAAGELAPSYQDCFVVPRKSEELYDVQADPFQLNNLIDDEIHRDAAVTMRTALSGWRVKTDYKTSENPKPDMFDRVTGKPLAEKKRRQP